MSDKGWGGWREGLLVAACSAVPMLVLLAAVPDSRGRPTVSLMAVMVAGALIMVATLIFYLHGLAAPGHTHGWVAAAMVLGSQVLLSSGLGLARPRLGTSDLQWASSVDLIVIIVAVGLVVLGAHGFSVADPLLLGLSIAVVLAVLKVAELASPAQSASSPTAANAMLFALQGGYVLFAALMWRFGDLPRRGRLPLTITVLLIGFAHFAGSGILDTWTVHFASSLALVVAASLWTSAILIMTRLALVEEHQRCMGLECSLLEIETSWRGGREQLHEIRSTLAGAASASRLLHEHAIDEVTHARLERMILVELGRLERMVTNQPPPDPGPVDLDATLGPLMVSHEVRGRDVSWMPTGTRVHARPDDVIEALNILLDNAATHGGASSRVAVTDTGDVVEIAVSDQGPGIPPERRDQIFEWGVRGDDSPGQGIGLNLARRLVTEHGGSLTLAPPGNQGTSFVIRLPTARQSEENRVRGAGLPA